MIPISREWHLDVTSDEHACPEDFRRVFTEQGSSLYKLSLLLMGNRADAEQCFVAAFHQTVEVTGVPKHAIRSRAKLAIVQQAVHASKPRLERKLGGRLLSCNVLARDYLETLSGPQTLIRRVLSLRVFERFVFVLCLLERHSVEDCAVLLSCDVQDVLEGRTRALVGIASSGARVSC